MDFETALTSVREARNHVEAARDAIGEVRNDLDLDNEAHHEFLQELFESAYPEITAVASTPARDAIYSEAVASGGPVLSMFNEYAAYMELVSMVQGSENTNFSRPSNAFATEVAEANNPVTAAYSILRKNKRLTDNQVVTVLEAAFPIATNGLDEATRDYLYSLAVERGVTHVEVANAYVELAELITAVRFMEDEDEYEDEEA